MAYNERLADRVRALLPRRGLVEKKMMGGLTFMVNGKMCVGVLGEDIMVRIDPGMHEAALKRRGAREMDLTGRPMKGFVFVSESALNSKEDLNIWIEMALEFNKKAKASKPRRTTRSK